ncbi:hypothetical protein G9A89_001923 [Geosiphon pyriformis]|nr:hypothetical protein G9A89_001923 [Geosiphon pyriformis]
MSIGNIDNFSFEVNSIIVFIKVLIIKAIQYQALIRKETLIDIVWRKAVKYLDGCSHNNDKIWKMAIAKIEDTIPEKIKTIKNNPPEFKKIIWISNPNIILNVMDPEQFYEHYQELALTKKEQEQWLKELNT